MNYIPAEPFALADGAETGDALMREAYLRAVTAIERHGAEQAAQRALADLLADVSLPAQ